MISNWTCAITDFFLIFYNVICVQLLSSSQWDEALLTMSKGETARLEIDPEWAYGRKGLPESKYPLF